jgi:hypothetical protein
LKGARSGDCYDPETDSGWVTGYGWTVTLIVVLGRELSKGQLALGCCLAMVSYVRERRVQGGVGWLVVAWLSCVWEMETGHVAEMKRKEGKDQSTSLGTFGPRMVFDFQNAFLNRFEFK